jgi:Ser/Thr protein kinase RdoA (MazF antagonist)
MDALLASLKSREGGVIDFGNPLHPNIIFDLIVPSYLAALDFDLTLATLHHG